MNINTLKKTIISLATAGTFLITVGAANSSSVFAQNWRWRDGWDNRVERHQEHDGYADGVRKGRQDAFDHRGFDPNSAKYFRDGNSEYREGFRRGYADGFRQAQGPWGDNRIERRQEQDGYNDGLNRGREDARDHRRFDPNNSEHFRNGNGEYREGFRRGYVDGFRQYESSRRW